MKSASKIVVTLPTYNEAENIERLITELLQVDPRVHVLVADDDSPDGTWKIAKVFASRNPKVDVLHRTENRGRGLAGREAFQVALDKGADVVLEMDADFSHQPAHVPAMLEALEDADIVIGSRLVSGGEDVGRGKHRVWITGLSTLYNRVMLGVKVKDCNSGFRMYRRSALEAIELPSMVAVGPEIVPEVLIRAARKGQRIVEVPIRFVEREAGESNLTLPKLLNVLRFTLRLSWLDKTGRLFKKADASPNPNETPEQ